MHTHNLQLLRYDATLKEKRNLLIFLNLKTGLNEDGTLNLLDELEEDVVAGHLFKLNDLKSQNANLKAIAAVGGFNEPLNANWSSMAANSVSRNTFVQSCLQFIEENKLNGIDIDWEYPNSPGNQVEDKDNFVLLLQDLKKALGPKSLSVSAAIGAGEWRTGQSYKVPEIFAACDFVNLMT